MIADGWNVFTGTSLFSFIVPTVSQSRCLDTYRHGIERSKTSVRSIPPFTEIFPSSTSNMLIHCFFNSEIHTALESILIASRHLMGH